MNAGETAERGEEVVVAPRHSQRHGNVGRAQDKGPEPDRRQSAQFRRLAWEMEEVGHDTNGIHEEQTAHTVANQVELGADPPRVDLVVQVPYELCQVRHPVMERAVSIA